MSEMFFFQKSFSLGIELNEMKEVVGIKDREIQRINMLMRYVKPVLLA